MNKPFFKWAGSKYRVLPHILPLIGTPTRYIEPFAGSLSVALNVVALEYILNDFNNDLIDVYKCVMHSAGFINDCEKYFTANNNDIAFYYFRNEFNNTIMDARHRAILFVYLNRHCFNGLTRYNKSGEFNVPFGKYKSPYFPRKEMENFISVFTGQSVEFSAGDFAADKLYQNVDSSTVVYFDPPYLPLTDTANFSDYATGGFDYDDQVRLRDLAVSLANRGARVIISNHDTPVARELYSSAQITSIDVGRFIAAKGTSRKKVKEVLAVWN